jgi:hypothetical protein
MPFTKMLLKRCCSYNNIVENDWVRNEKLPFTLHNTQQTHKTLPRKS